MNDDTTPSSSLSRQQGIYHRVSLGIVMLFYKSLDWGDLYFHFQHKGVVLKYVCGKEGRREKSIVVWSGNLCDIDIESQIPIIMRWNLLEGGEC